MAITFGGRSWVPREQAQTNTSSGGGSGSSVGWSDLFRWARNGRSAYNYGNRLYNWAAGGTESGAGGTAGSGGSGGGGGAGGAGLGGGGGASGIGTALEGSEASYAGLTGELGAESAGGYAGAEAAPSGMGAALEGSEASYGALGASGGADMSIDAAGGYYGGSSATLGSSAGSGAASQGMSGAASSAGGMALAQWVPVLAVAIMAYDAYTRGSGRNDPIADTRQIQLGSREFTNLSRGNEYQPGDWALGRNVPVYDQIGQTMSQEWQPYNQESMGDLYREIHSMSHGGSARSTDRSAVTDQEIDDYLRSQGVTNEQISRAIGQNVPDWASGFNSDRWQSEELQAINAGRESRWQRGQSTPEDLRYYGVNSDDPTYWSLLGGQNPVTDIDIDNYLTNQGVTQDELAQALGTEAPDWSRMTYSQWLADQWSNQFNEAQRALESGNYDRYYELIGQPNYYNINA